MVDITDINSRRPHITLEMECEHCTNVWQAVFPDEAKELQCPRCEKMTPLQGYCRTVHRSKGMSAKAEELLGAINWVNNDVSYKAPEQLTSDLFAGYVDKLMGHMKVTITELERLEAEVERLSDPDWKTYIGLTEKWLEKYPPDIFTGESGDSGPVFVVAIRAALYKLRETS